MSGELREHLVAYFEDHHKILETGALQLLLDDTQPLALSRQLLELAKPEALLVTREMVEGALARRNRVSPSPRAGAGRGSDRGPDRGPGSAVRPDLRRVHESTLNPGPLEAYGALFNSRFQQLSRLLRGRSDLPNLRPIKELRPVEGRASIIAMIRDVRLTAEKHHVILQVEDESGAIDLLVPRDSLVSRTTFLPDEIIGAHLQLPRERGRLPRVLSVERPDVSLGRKVGRATVPSRGTLLVRSPHWEPIISGRILGATGIVSPRTRPRTRARPIDRTRRRRGGSGGRDRYLSKAGTRPRDRGRLRAVCGARASVARVTGTSEYRGRSG